MFLETLLSASIVHDIERILLAIMKLNCLLPLFIKLMKIIGIF